LLFKEGAIDTGTITGVQDFRLSGSQSEVEAGNWVSIDYILSFKRGINYSFLLPSMKLSVVSQPRGE
jgi:hypothetical protein